MSDQCPITVLMSVYNEENFLSAAIQSVLNQTFHDFEFLIIDDASTDMSAKIIRSFKDKRIRYLKNASNIGLTRSLNRGIGEARAKYISRLDGNDISLPRRLEKQYDFLEKHRDFVLCASFIEVVDEFGKSIEFGNYRGNCEDIFLDLHFHNVIAHSSVTFKREVALQLGGYNEKYFYAQDFKLWQNLSRVGKINIVDEILMRRREVSEGISCMKFAEQSKSAIKIIKDNLYRYYKTGCERGLRFLVSRGQFGLERLNF